MTNNTGERSIGFTQGVRACVTWLHEEAKTMNDPHARQVLNNAAFHIGQRKPTLFKEPTLPPGEWTDEQVEAAAFAARSARHRLYAETPAKYGSAHSKEQMDGIEIAAFRAVLATITPTAGGRPTTATTTKEK